MIKVPTWQISVMLRLTKEKNKEKATGTSSPGLCQSCSVAQQHQKHNTGLEGVVKINREKRTRQTAQCPALPAPRHISHSYPFTANSAIAPAIVIEAGRHN